jgi:hypothetical protein
MGKMESGLPCVLDEAPYLEPASPTVQSRNGNNSNNNTPKYHSSHSSSNSLHSDDGTEASTDSASFDGYGGSGGGVGMQQLDLTGVVAEHFEAIITTKELGMTVGREVYPHTISPLLPVRRFFCCKNRLLRLS